MLLRILLEVDVVEQSYHSPEIHYVGKAQLTGIPAHHPFDGQRMLQVERVFVVFSQQFQGCLPCNLTFHYLTVFMMFEIASWPSLPSGHGQSG